MRHNRYAYIIQLDDDRHVIFNGLNKKFILLNERHLPSYEALMADPDAYIHSHSKIIQELRDGLFIVENDFNELEEVRKERQEYINAPVFKSSIIPTFECNYKCWYCKQRHQPLNPEEIRLDKVVRHIKKYLKDNNIKEYILSWYGGEPLSQPDIIESVSLELLDFCIHNNIKFYGAITTNGALLSQPIVELLKRCQINEYQIAIDGDKKSHDQNKYDDLHESSFDLVLRNMSYLICSNQNAKVTLRLNHTPQNIEDTHLVDEINSIIPESIRNRITIDLQRIWQIDEREYNLVNLNRIGRKFVDSGYRLSTSHIFAMCYVEKKHYNTFYYTGQVEKCDLKTMSNLRGNIDENGDIIWKQKPLFDQFDVLGNNSDCSECDYYPICYCGCPVRREDSIVRDNRIKCGFENDFSKLEHRIKDYCNRVLNNSMLQIHVGDSTLDDMI